MSVDTPRLTVGLPTHNGVAYLAESLDCLLAQTYDDFEVLVSDNASTDATEQIARSYAERDPRVRYVRQPTNIGAVPNHNWCIDQAHGEFFKWASDDDRYAPDLLRLCVEALDARPEIVLAHAWTAFLDADGQQTHAPAYPLDTDRPDAPGRFRSLLMTPGGDDIYGVIRMSVLRGIRHGSYHQADRVFTGTLALWGAFHQVPDHLYFRRDHPHRTGRASSIRDTVVRFDPRRADRLRHPTARLLAEYVGGYLSAIGRAPLTSRERAECVAHLLRWAGDRVVPRRTTATRPGAGATSC